MSQTYTQSAPATSAASESLRRGLLAVWAVFTLGALAYVVLVGTNAPYADEWEFVPALVGEEPALPWLWQQHNEHRLPLPRLIVLGLFRLTHDFRAGMLLQVVALSALALYLMRLAASLRGKPHWADAFFPVSLLHVGHWENFIMGYQICFVLFCVLATAIVVVALRATRERAFRSGVAAGVLLLLLVLTGGSGLAVVPPVAGWILLIAASVWRRGANGRAAMLILLALVPVAYLGVYFVEYQKPEHHPELSSNPLLVARVTGQVLSMSFGMGLAPAWWVLFPGLLALGGSTAYRLIYKWGEPESRPSTLGLLALAAGVAGVAVAIGVGRAGLGENMGLWPRYSLLTWPLLATTYLVWVRDRGSKWVPVALCVAAALAFPGNVGVGVVNGALVKSNYAAIEADAARGLGAEAIVEKHFPESHQTGQEERAVRGIPLLRKYRIGIFAGN